MVSGTIAVMVAHVQSRPSGQSREKEAAPQLLLEKAGDFLYINQP
jgi:hypothetical protein